MQCGNEFSLSLHQRRNANCLVSRMVDRQSKAARCCCARINILISRTLSVAAGSDSSRAACKALLSHSKSYGSTVRFLQFLHEKPLLLFIVSSDLSEFYHVHPEMQVDDSCCGSDRQSRAATSIAGNKRELRMNADFRGSGNQPIT